MTRPRESLYKVRKKKENKKKKNILIIFDTDISYCTSAI